MLIHIAHEKPDSLVTVPEFVIENINDVTGQLFRFRPDFIENTVEQDFLLTCYTFVTLYMESPKYAFNPHLRKDLGPLLETCCPFSKGRAGDGAKGAALTMAGQLRHQEMIKYLT